MNVEILESASVAAIIVRSLLLSILVFFLLFPSFLYGDMVGMVLNIMVSHQWGCPCPCPCQAAHSYSDLFSQADIVEAR